MAEVILLVTPDRRRLIERTAREVVLYRYEPRTRLDRIRTALRREITGDGKPTPLTRGLEDQLEALVEAEIDHLSASMAMPVRPGGDAA